MRARAGDDFARDIVYTRRGFRRLIYICVYIDAFSYSSSERLCLWEKLRFSFSLLSRARAGDISEKLTSKRARARADSGQNA